MRRQDHQIFIAVLRAALLRLWYAVQTKVFKPKDAMTMTEPPPSQSAGGSTSQWRIFDAYRAHQEKSKAAEDQVKAKSVAAAKKRPGDVSSAHITAKVCRLFL